MIQINQYRIVSLQNRIINSQPFFKLSGGISRTKIDKDDFDSFIRRFPTVESHYSKSKRLYFSNHDLNYTKLFSLYEEQFPDSKLGRTTFIDYFKLNFNIRFRPNRTDECDFCFECKLNSNYNSDDKYLEHILNVDKHDSLKKMFINDIENFIVFAFDYSQNKPLPKLSNSKIYYTRQLYMYLFNIHVYPYNEYNFSDRIYYHSFEGEQGKNSNTVCSNLYHIIECYKISEIIDKKC